MLTNLSFSDCLDSMLVVSSGHGATIYDRFLLETGIERIRLTTIVCT